jgi:rod shape-determining protein MreD
VSFLKAALGLILALAVQAGVGRLWPDSLRYIDLMYLPVIWYGIKRSQAQAMWVGCIAGLMADSWFQAGVFGLSGFKKTILGWTLGGLGGRFDFNGQTGRFMVGVSIALIDTALDQGLRRLLDQQPGVPGVIEVLVRALLMGLLTAWVFSGVDRMKERSPMRRKWA